MSRKTIVLADNSYTIRRIVELSFSDETDIELVTFENGLNLREKLIELSPEVVLVDIKLPEFDGYDVCKFVQENDSLAHTKVFLLKGGFEPIDENLLQNIQYEDIITKPFDSNALVSNIKKLLEEMPGHAPPVTAVEMPSSLPEDEDIPEIDTMPEPPKEISFSDVKEEIESEGILPDEDELMPGPGAFPDDEVLPSEEITRAQPDKDTISPSMEDEDNPFDDVSSLSPPPRGPMEESLTEEELNIKRNIELQEKELEIDSLTLEEINIKRDIERQERVRSQDGLEFESEMSISDEGEEQDVDTSDMFPESKLEPQDDLFTFDRKKSESFEPTHPGFDAIEKEILSKEAMPEPEIPDIKYETDIGRKVILEMEPLPVEETQPPRPEPKVGGVSSIKMDIPEPEFPPMMEDLSDQDAIQFDSAGEIEEEAGEFASEVTAETPSVREYEIPDLKKPPTPPTPVMRKRVEEEIPEPDLVIPKPSKPVETPDTWEILPPAAQVKPEKKIPEVQKTPTPIPTPTPAPTLEPKPTPEMKKIPDIKHEEIVNKIEDRLTLAIKEMLWEIVPPLAEKIIKEEINALKSEAEKSLT